MGTVQTLTRLLLIGWLVIASLGCAQERSFSQSVTDMKRTLRLESEPPVSQLFCSWQRRLNVLQDPSHDGMQVPGIVGQVFMVNQESTAAHADGDLTITAYDQTARPAGMPEKPPSVWHFTKEVLHKMRTQDERFGPCYVVFLPWPPEWTDVRQVRLLGRYQGRNKVELYAPEVMVSIDFTSPGQTVWNNVQKQQRYSVPGAPGQTPGFTPGFAGGDRRGAVDPTKMLAGMQQAPGMAPGLAQGLPPAIQDGPMNPQGLVQNFHPLVRPQGQGLPEVKSNVPVYGEPILPVQGAMPQPVSSQPPQLPPGVIGQLSPHVPSVVPQLPPGSNTAHATEGAFAGPRPANARPLAPAGSDAALQPVVIPIRRENPSAQPSK